MSSTTPGIWILPTSCRSRSCTTCNLDLAYIPQVDVRYYTCNLDLTYAPQVIVKYYTWNLDVTYVLQVDVKYYLDSGCYLRPVGRCTTWIFSTSCRSMSRTT